ncbi:armadillo repeat-containing protein 1-like isoform X1 [Alligator sinensis]|uniref:Armadillo repeat-containing protein 1 n=1 Tax=Alligator sinensis TaxID=38654 RepID=A0A3Q0FUW7_ALLSI|nr:armadillo repeat-containing protein 1-like isoform X1 [Alligator sinensis]
MNSTMSEEPDALAVVNQLRDLAADPLNRRAIVQDQGCLPGLILFLDHPNPPVVHSALLALRYLAECRANREKMKSELGMMLSLQTVIQKEKLQHDPTPSYLGVTLNHTITFCNYLQKIAVKTWSQVNIVWKLAGTSWGATAGVPCTSVMALVFSTVEYYAPV